LRRQNPQISEFVGPGLQHFHLDQDFGLALIEVGDNLLHQRQLVGRIANEDGALGVDLLDALQIEELSQAGG